MARPSLATRLLAYAATLPQGHLLYAHDLTHLGKRVAISRALVRLAASGHLRRMVRGLYCYPTPTRFGDIYATPTNLAAHLNAHGVAVTESGAASANLLGITTQVVVHYYFWTSGPTRTVTFDAWKVKFQHVPPYCLLLPNTVPGAILRALAYESRFGHDPQYALSAIKHIRYPAPLPAEMQTLLALFPQLPSYLHPALRELELRVRSRPPS